MRMFVPSRALGWLLIALLLPAGCLHRGPTPPPAVAPEAAWVVIDAVQMGSVVPLSAYVWVDGHRDDYETVLDTKGPSPPFHGFGKTAQGHRVEFAPGQKLTFVAWSVGHELAFIDTTLVPGENVVVVQLRKTAVADTRVPLEIWIDVLERMLEVRAEGELPRTGS